MRRTLTEINPKFPGHCSTGLVGAQPNLKSDFGGLKMRSRFTLAIMALSLGGCFTLADPPATFAQSGGQQHEKKAPTGTDNRGKRAVPREAAPRKSAPRETAPRRIAPREAAPRKSAPRETAPRRIAPREAAPRKSAPRETAPRRIAPREAAPRKIPPRDPPPVRAARVDFAACRPGGPVGPQFTVETLRRGAADTVHVAAAAGEPLERLVP